MSANAMHVAKSGLNAQQTRMQIIANNLANVNTAGFKKDRANFESLLYQVRRYAGDQTSADTNLTSSFAIGTGTRIVNTEKMHSQGSLMMTENALDLAIEGGGFFQVLMPDNRIGYTRNGSFSRNDEGTLTTASGYVLQPEIQIPEGATNINVSANGIVSVTLAGETAAQEVGQLVQGALESSNVNVVQELVDMIETQRAYEVSSKAITSVDEMLRFISNNL
jgi:flagellar basal-body rod protein FlgG